jgi:dienelactone hydrolase
MSPCLLRQVVPVIALLACGAAAAAPPPIESFFENPAFTSALLSPDARRLGVRVGAEGKRDLLAVLDLETRAVKVVAHFADADIGQFEWVNNNRLIFNAVDKRLGVGERQDAPGLYAVDSDGAHFRQLANRQSGSFVRDGTARPLLPWHTYMVRQQGAQDSDFVYVTSPTITRDHQVTQVDLLRLNTVTGRAVEVGRPADTRTWLLDHKGEPRLAGAIKGGTEQIWYRDPATDRWRKLVEFDLYPGGKGGFTPLAFGPDSTGFGFKHYRAGWKQWGMAMQDDIADGAKWAIAEGIVDPQRICIAGASYGGYATLMGLLNDPGLFKCGIDWVGVTDIKLLYTGHWSFSSDLSDTYKQYGMPELVGDQVRDAAQLAATSPLLQAARIRQPLLLAYGGADKRVPLYHGKKFYDAVRLTNPDVEWVVYEDEGHGWAVPKNRVDFWRRVEKFLDRNIGKH